MCSFHFELEQALSAALGHSVGILNGATKDGNKSVTRLKRESQILAQREAEHREQMKKTRMQCAEQSQKVAENHLSELQGKVLTTEQIQNINIRKMPFGMALLSYKDVLDLKRTAERVNEVDEKEKQAEKILKRYLQN